MHFHYKRVAAETGFVIVMLLLLIGIAQKLFHFSITNDEAYSFYLVKTNYINALVGTANTHWINSVFIKLETLVLGNEVWMWRLHLLFFFLLYLLAARAIAVSYFNGWWTWIVFLLLVANPYLNDFFSIARGYGPAVACMSWAVYFFAKNFKQYNKRTFLFACSCAALAVLSNYTLLYFFLPAGLVVAAFILKKQLHGFVIRENKTAFVVAAGTFLFAVANLLFIKFYTGDLETGGDTSLLYDTIGSLIKNTSYGYVTETPVAAGWILFLVFVFLLSFAVANYHSTNKIGLFHFVTFTLAGALMMGIAFHLLFQTPYNEGRTAVYLYPLFILCFCSGIVLMIKQLQLKKGIAVLIFGCSVAATAFSIKAAYTGSCFETRDQVGIDQVMLKLKNRYASSTTIALPSWHFGIHANYYQLLYPDAYTFRTRKYEYPHTSTHTDSVINIMKQCDEVVLYPAGDTTVLHKAGFRFTNVEILKNSDVVILKPE
jgi:hypothetical protein